VKTLRALKIVLLWVCLIGFPIGAFWVGGRLHEARHVSEDIWSQSRFAQLKLALEIYHEEHGAFPPTKYQPVAGGPIHSWRILLVPHTSADERYSNYDFTQEWNSTSNLQALSGWPAPNRRIMPSLIFRMIGGGDGDIAHYLAIGEDDDWPSRKPLKSILVKKGKDRFLLIEFPDSEIHWMEPKY
jgi:hypothetical protein